MRKRAAKINEDERHGHVWLYDAYGFFLVYGILNATLKQQYIGLCMFVITLSGYLIGHSRRVSLHLYNNSLMEGFVNITEKREKKR